MEEVRRIRSLGEREVSLGAEDGNLIAESVHHASIVTGSNGRRAQPLRRRETRTQRRGEWNDRMEGPHGEVSKASH